MKRTWLMVRPAAAVGACLCGIALCSGVVFALRTQNVRPRVATDVLGEWVSVGPSPYVRNAFARQGNPQVTFSGRVASIAVDPTNPSHWLLGVGNGGVWETRDAGGHWAPLTDTAPTLSTGDIAFDPTNPSTIYVGTGEARAGGLAKVGVGILKSTDAGQTWKVLGASSFARGSIKRLRINPARPDELIAASTRGGYGRFGTLVSSPPPYGVLKSNDAGQTWTRTLAGQATALEIDSANFNRQYAAIGEDQSGQADGVEANGLYRSNDAGQHWQPIGGPWGALTVGRIELAIAPSNANILYASVTQPDGTRIMGLYRTDNAWDDAPIWRQVSTAQASSDCSACGGATGTYCVGCNYSHVLSVSPSDPNMLFAGGKVMLSRCTTCASTPQWKTVTDGNVDLFADQQAIAWAGSRLILGNDGGIFSSTDLGASWQNHNAGLATTMFYNGALHPTDPGFIIAGARDHGLVVERDGSSTWANVPPPPGISGEWGGEGEVALSSKHPETDWMANTVNATIWRTTDGGRTAVRVDTGIDKTGGALYPTPVRKCPVNDDVFLAGMSPRLWRTDNFFNSTTPSWSVNGPSGSDATSGTITSIAFVASDTNCNTYAYGTSRSEIRLTRDGGKSWTDLDPAKTLPPFGINDIAFDPTNGDTMYIANSNFNTGSAKPRHVFKTTNASAASPTLVNISPPDDVPFDAVAIDPRRPNLVYAGSDTGLWVSGDAGSTWAKVGLDRGMPNAAIYDIKINAATNQTVVFTHGRGAYRLAASQ